jgi:competence protein ComEC
MRFNKNKIRRTTLVALAMLIFLIVLGLARLRPSLIQTAVLVLGTGALAWVTTKRYPAHIRSLIALLFIITSILASWQGYRYMNELVKYQDIYGKTIILEATAREDSIYSDRKQLVFSADNIYDVTNGRPLVGNIQIEGFGEPMVYRSNRLRIEGKLFPKRGDHVAGISFAKITAIDTTASAIDTVRRQFAAGLQNILPEPLASLALGLLLGQRNTLPKTFNDQLMTVGLIHIVAVSGYNLTVIINASKRLLAKRSRYQALIGSIALIWVFLLLTGSSPSIVRAAFVSIIGLIAWFYGRSVKPIVLLLITAAITAGINPLYLWASIGWYLSFTAFYGVLVLAPLLQNRIFKKRQPKVLSQILIETLAAQLCTLPILLYIFGNLSLVGVVANVFVVPIVPFAMIGSLVAGIIGIIGHPVLTALLIVPARLPLDFITILAELFSTVPRASINITASLTQMILMYCMVLLLTYVLWKKHPKPAIISVTQ